MASGRAERGPGGEHGRGGSPRRRLTAEQRREVIERAATEVFAAHGYHGASMAEIARRAGVTPPILYDHFASKRDLHRRLLERHFAELREVWREHLLTDAPAAQRVPAAFDAWFAYIEEHPFVGRMLFRDTTGDPEVEAIRRDVAARSREQARPLLAREPGAEAVAGSPGDVAMDLAWEVVRAVLQGLALWWSDHPEVPRAQIVATAMNALWIGFERASRGETWQPPAEPPGAPAATGAPPGATPAGG